MCIRDSLDHVSLSRKLVFFDGRDSLQVSLAQRNLDGPSGKSKLIMVAGEPLKLMRSWKRPVFYDQGGALEMCIRDSNQIAFRYRSVDSSTGITRETAKRLAGYLGVDETQAIHQALRELAIKLLPQYEADNGPLTAIQLRQIKKIVPQATKRSVRSSLFEDVIA